MTRKSVVLLSGGLDSAANLAFCVERDEAVLALTVDYGQRAALRELARARQFCEYYGVLHQAVALPWLGRLGGSSLTDVSVEVPLLNLDRLDDLRLTEKTGRQVWVPNRNGVLIQVAAAFAERLSAEQVVVGFNREEAVTFPDNSGEFLRRSTDALAFSTLNQVSVYSYTTEFDKREIVSELKKLNRGFHWDWVWSCYFGGEKVCGACESCRRFQRATQDVSLK